jgi:hypothetical protein
MFGKKVVEFFKHLNFLSLSVPVGVIVANAIFRLQPLIRQAFVGVLLMWFGVEAITGFELWQ